MTDAEQARYEALVASLMQLVRAKNELIAELERELTALRERLAGARPN